MFKFMNDKRPSIVVLMLPGIVLIVLGLLIVLEPKVLVWLVALASIAMGVAMLALAGIIRRLGDRFYREHHPAG